MINTSTTTGLLGMAASSAPASTPSLQSSPQPATSGLPTSASGNPFAGVPAPVAAWNALLDQGVASVALSAAGTIVAVGSASDVRHMLMQGVTNSLAWEAVTHVPTKLDITQHLSRLDGSSSFWPFAESYKDAQRHRRPHTKLQVNLSGKQQATQHVDSHALANSKSPLYAASLHSTNYKFLLDQSITRVVVVVPYTKNKDASYPSAGRLSISNARRTGAKISVEAGTPLQVLRDLQSLQGASGGTTAQAIDEPFWQRCLAHGFAQQLRLDFGITSSTADLEAVYTRNAIGDFCANEKAGEPYLSATRYVGPPNAPNDLERRLQQSHVALYGQLKPLVMHPALANVVLAFLDTGDWGIALGIPGLSSEWAIVRPRRKGEPDENSIISSAAVLEEIRQNQEGGVVRARRLFQVLAITWVIISVCISLAVGIFNFGNREAFFERASDVGSTATLLLVSVFGLIKLQSEDGNAIRNTLLGKRILRTAGDVKRHFARRRLQVPFALALAATRQPLKWLAEGNTSYLRHRPLGSIAFTDGVSSDDLLLIGIVIGKTAMLDFRTGRSRVATVVSGQHVTLGDSLSLTYLKNNTVFGDQVFVVG